MLKRQNKHKELSAALRDALARGDYVPDQKLPSEKEIAGLYGVSRTTVREAISSLVHEGLVLRSQGMRMTVAKKPDESRDIAFVLCGREYTDPHYSRILRGAEQRCAQLGYRLLYSHWAEPTDVRSIKNALLDHRPVKGIVVTGSPTLKHLIELMDMNPNLVLVGDVAGRDRTPELVVQIVSNDYEAAGEAVRYLIGLGHRRIAHITGDLNRCWFRDAHDAYRKCLEEQGLPVEAGLLVECPDQGLENGYEAAQQLLRIPDRPTAIFGANDRLAWGAIRAIRQARLRIPEDISVIGTGDLPLGDQRDLLTTMAGAQVEMGALAADRIVKGAGGLAERIVLPMTLAVRKSCAAPRDSRDEDSADISNRLKWARSSRKKLNKGGVI